MIAVIQRVTEAKVEVEGKTVGACGKGFLVLLGVAEGDTERDMTLLADKIRKLRVFEDENGKMNKALTDVDGGLLVISQFTLLANYAHGNRPDFFGAAKPAVAEPLFEQFCSYIKEYIPKTEKGIFGADMQVSLVNDGPVTIVMDSKILR
ncbi:MAG: D-tyrosyl-tRNA(Tyr) deacylase [Clostridia bacterium]|nr:D-tyrosyl-tRNA(Tyr) deacylase [Clostridia bacterium]